MIGPQAKCCGLSMSRATYEKIRPELWRLLTKWWAKSYNCRAYVAIWQST